MAEIVIITADGQKLKGKYEAMKMCKPIEEFYKDNKPEIEIPLPQVNGNTLQKIINFCEQFHNKSIPLVEKPIKTNKLSEIIRDAWTCKFLEMPLKEMYELLMACDYLGLKGLEDLVGCAVAVRIVGKTVDDIRKEFGITNDFTPAEENEIKEFFSWAEELWQ